MKRIVVFLCLLMCFAKSANALRVKQYMHTTIGLFDATEQTLAYSFDNGSYDIKTTLKTIGTFGLLYRFRAMYHSKGYYRNSLFLPETYYQEAESRSHRRTKEIVYENGVPQYRISIKDAKRRQDEIILDEKYSESGDLLSVLGALIEQIRQGKGCDLKRYSFGGKHYSLSQIKTIGKENIKTEYFAGEALKCQYSLEIVDDAEAGFLLNSKEPIYFWVLKDEKTQADFLARILVESTPFGKLEAVTTKVEVSK